MVAGRETRTATRRCASSGDAVHSFGAFVLLVASCMPSTSHAKDPFEAPLREMRRIDAELSEPSQKAPLLEKVLGSIVAALESRDIATLADDDIRDIYDAARIAAFYSYGI